MNTTVKKAKKIKQVCPECFKETDIIADDDGFFRFKCPYCGAKSIKKFISRRHKQIDIYT